MWLFDNEIVKAPGSTAAGERQIAKVDDTCKAALVRVFPKTHVAEAAKNVPIIETAVPPPTGPLLGTIADSIASGRYSKLRSAWLICVPSDVTRANETRPGVPLGAMQLSWLLVTFSTAENADPILHLKILSSSDDNLILIGIPPIGGPQDGKISTFFITFVSDLRWGSATLKSDIY